MKKFDVDSPITFWIELLKDPYSEACREVYKLVPEIKAAKDAFERIKTDPEKMNLIEAREEALLNYRADLAEAKREGEKRGEKRGLKKGRIEVSKNMLSLNLPLETVSQTCGLTLDEIRSLQ